MYVVEVAEKGTEDFTDNYAGILTFKFNDLAEALLFIRKMLEHEKTIFVTCEDQE